LAADILHLRNQLRAARALVKFIEEHKGKPDAELKACLAALERKDLGAAVRHARNVKIAGRGSITDWFPPTVYPHESEEYVWTELEALAHHWWRLMNLSSEDQR
jgi:hypothetical protein